MIKSVLAPDNQSGLPPCIANDATAVTDRASILDCFNEHFIASGPIISRSSPPVAAPALDPVPSAPDADHMSVGRMFAGQPSFGFRLFSVEEVCRAPLSLDITKSAGTDCLEPVS